MDLIIAIVSLVVFAALYTGIRVWYGDYMYKKYKDGYDLIDAIMAKAVYDARRSLDYEISEDEIRHTMLMEGCSRSKAYIECKNMHRYCNRIQQEVTYQRIERLRYEYRKGFISLETLENMAANM